jgi:transcriptional regulator with XRE-family HTH domain
VRLIDPDRLVQDVGRRLAELREARGLTQQEVADELGVSMRHVQAVEAGTKNLTLRSIAVFANAVRARLPEVFEPPIASRRGPGRPKKTRPTR